MDQEITRNDGAVEVQLVCDPFFSMSNDQENLHHSRSYIMLSLGKLATGEWLFSARLEGQGNDMVFVLERSRKVRKRRRKMRLVEKRAGWTQPFQWQKVETHRLPLYFDAGGNCVHVGERGRDFRELGLALPAHEAGETDQADHMDGDDSGGDEESQLLQAQIASFYTSDHVLAGQEARPRGAKPSGSLRNLERVDPLERRKTPSWKGTENGF